MVPVRLQGKKPSKNTVAYNEGDWATSSHHHLPTFHQGNAIHQLLKRWSMQLVLFLNSLVIYTLTLTPTIEHFKLS
jgi:hypothetical protein